MHQLTVHLYEFAQLEDVLHRDIHGLVLDLGLLSLRLRLSLLHLNGPLLRNASYLVLGSRLSEQGL